MGGWVMKEYDQDEAQDQEKSPNKGREEAEAGTR
jgi:hypothetical protein